MKKGRRPDIRLRESPYSASDTLRPCPGSERTSAPVYPISVLLFSLPPDYPKQRPLYLPQVQPSFRLSILKLIHPFFPFLHISHSNLFTGFNLADPPVQFLNPRTAASGRLCFRGVFYVMKQLYQLPAYSLRHSSMVLRSSITHANKKRSSRVSSASGFMTGPPGSFIFFILFSFYYTKALPPLQEYTRITYPESHIHRTTA